VNRYPDAERAGSIIEQLKRENEALRATVKLMAEERGRLELELKQCRRLGARLRNEERLTHRD